MISVETPNRRGRKPRYGVVMQALHVRFHPRVLAAIKHDAALRQLRDPDQEWSASRVVEEHVTRLYGLDLSHTDA